MYKVSYITSNKRNLRAEQAACYSFYFGEGVTSAVAPEDWPPEGDCFFQSLTALADSVLVIESKLDKEIREPFESFGRSAVADIRAFPSTPCASASFQA